LGRQVLNKSGQLKESKPMRKGESRKHLQEISEDREGQARYCNHSHQPWAGQG